MSDVEGQTAHLEDVLFALMQAFVMSTAFDLGTAGLPLPNGERAGVRGDQALDRS
jgi:hypothetical protein